MDKRRYFREDIPFRVLIFILIGAGAVAIMGFVVRFLWNYTVPELFGLKEISFWQAVALVILTRILFGSFGKGPYGRRGRRFGPPPGLKEKLMNMSEEERQHFKEQMRRRCEK